MPSSAPRLIRALGLLRRVHDGALDVGPWGDDEGETEAVVCDECGGTIEGALHKPGCVIKAIEDFLAEPPTDEESWDALTREALRTVLGWFTSAIGDAPVTPKISAGLDWARAIAERDVVTLEDARARWAALLNDPEPPKGKN